jgi:hypothetical protein
MRGGSTARRRQLPKSVGGDKAQEVRNCSVTHYAFDTRTGTNGKLVLRDFNRVYYSKTCG